MTHISGLRYFFIRDSFEGDMMLPLITGRAFLLTSESLTITTFLLFRKLLVSVFDLEITFLDQNR